MSPIKPNDLARVGELEKRIADLETLVRQIPTRVGMPEVARTARWVYQNNASVTFVPGDIVAYNLGRGWEVSTGMIQSSPGACGVVERVVGDRVLVVFEGHINTEGWTTPPDQFAGDGKIAIKPTGGDTAIVVQSPRTEHLALVIFDTATSGRIGKAVIGYSSITSGFITTSDTPTVGVVKGMDEHLPMVQAGVYRAILLEEITGVGQYHLVGFDLDMAVFPARFGEVSALDGTLPSRVLITDPSAGTYWNAPATAIAAPTGQLLQVSPTTTIVGEAASFPITRISVGAVDERAYAVGDIIPITPGIGASVVLAPGLNELRDVDVSDDPENYQVLRWSTTTKRWGSGHLFPAGGTVNQVLTKTGSGMYDLTWADGGSGGVTSISVGSDQGLFVDANTGDVTLDIVPFRNKGELTYCDGLNGLTRGGNTCYPMVRLAFPGSTARNALLVSDATDLIPKWVKAIEVGDTTNGGGSLKIWYTAGYYLELNSSGSLKITYSSSNSVEIASADFVGSSKVVKLRELDVCNDSGEAKKILALCSDLY